MEKNEYLKLSSKKGTLSLSIPQLSEVNLRARVLKRVFLAHLSITGSLCGLFFGLILGILNVPIAIFFAPLLAGVLAGYLQGSGVKAGVLTLLLPILVILTIPIVFPTVDWAASTMPEVEGIEPVGSTLAVLTNGLIHST